LYSSVQRVDSSRVQSVHKILGGSVAKGPKFQPQNPKGAEENFVGPEKSGAEYLPDLSKKGQKGAELFLKFNKAKFLTEN
jgi:hypothetical protein